jgi:hypothetical protein
MIFPRQTFGFLPLHCPILFQLFLMKNLEIVITIFQIRALWIWQENVINRIRFVTNYTHFLWLIQIFQTSGIHISFILQVPVHNFHWSPNNTLYFYSKQKYDGVLLLNFRHLLVIILAFLHCLIDCFICFTNVFYMPFFCPINTPYFSRWHTSEVALQLSKLMIRLTLWHFYFNGI